MRKKLRAVPYIRPQPPEELKPVYEKGSLGDRFQEALKNAQARFDKEMAALRQEDAKKQALSASEVATSDRMGLGHLTSLNGLRLQRGRFALGTKERTKEPKNHKE